MAQIVEAVAKQQKSFVNEYDRVPASKMVTESKEESVCKIESKPKKFIQRKSVPNNSFSGSCGRCGYKGHKASDANCPAKGKTCNNCGQKDHFGRCCFSRNGGAKSNLGKRKFDTSHNNATSNKVKREDVRMVDTNESDHTSSVIDEYEDIFCIFPNESSNKIWCKIGNVDTEVIVDSGTRHNIVDRASWMELKSKGVEITHRQKEVEQLKYFVDVENT